jgi:hypothetical protein
VIPRRLKNGFAIGLLVNGAALVADLQAAEFRQINRFPAHQQAASDRR